MPATLSRLGRKARAARQQLLRFILDAGLREGDRLPPQNRLRAELNMGATTITSALNALRDEGVLDIRDKVGVFVKRNNPNGMAGRTIAIGAPEVAGTAFGSMLICFIQSELQKNGCRASVFFNNGETGVPLTKDHFPGLRLSLDARQMDGFITTENIAPEAWNSLENAGLCPCYTGFSPNPPCGVTPALDVYSRDAALLCRDRYNIRPTLILTDPYYNPASLLEAGLCDAHRIEYNRGVGEDLMLQYLARPADRRPGAMVFFDDTVASEFACAVLRCGDALKGAYPRIVALRNLQIPIFMPLREVDWFELDIKEVARETVRLLLRRMRGEDLHETHVRVPIRPVER